MLTQNHSDDRTSADELLIPTAAFNLGNRRPEHTRHDGH
jgi:hypothetical protein